MSDVGKITSDIIFPMSHAVFPACVLRQLYERCDLMIVRNCIYVGAYGIRPVHSRVSRTAIRRHKIAKRRNSGRMQYAPTEVKFINLSGLLLKMQM